MAVRVFSFWAAILMSSFVFTHSIEAWVYEWVEENGTIHYSDKSIKNLKKFKKLKDTKGRVSTPLTASHKTGRQHKNVHKDNSKARERLTNLKGSVNTCQNLSQKIEHCETFTCQMPHSSFDRFVINHSISGMVGNNCHYEQTMPNNGLMTCNFSPWQRKQYGKLGGKETETLFNEAVENGNCVITGY